MNIDAITYDSLVPSATKAKEQRNQELIDDYQRLKEKLPLAKQYQLQRAIAQLYDMSVANVRIILRKANIA